jgi:hypothetical protein
MSDAEPERSAIGLFARACESLNEFARSLRVSTLFNNVRAGADIRYYETGWRLEKWIEASLVQARESGAVWWLELGPNESGGWLLESHLAITPEGEFINLPTRVANSLTDLEEQLRVSVDELVTALDRNYEFAKAVKG